MNYKSQSLYISCIVKMGIHCEINLFKPADGAFVPGETISGIIKYSVDEDTSVSRIIVSLKGKGFLRLKDKHRERRNRRALYTNWEDYVDIDHVIQENVKESVLPFGVYETNFNFQIPKNLPPSFIFIKHVPRFFIKCQIAYYVRIKFERPGIFNFNKHFRKDITMISGVTPKLPMEPTIFGETKKVFALFSGGGNTIDIKANVETCIVAPGQKIELNYEVINNSNVAIKGVETKLKEKLTFRASGCREAVVENTVPDTDTKTPGINSGDTQSMPIIINVPSDIMTLENSQVVSRDYVIRIVVNLPVPHFDAVLEVPVQLGYRTDVGVCDTNGPYGEPPPPYWQNMGEADDKKEGEISDGEE